MIIVIIITIVKFSSQIVDTAIDTLKNVEFKECVDNENHY